MARDHENRTFRLPDGRTLSFAEYGDANGQTAFYFHGHPGSRFEARLGHASATRSGVHMEKAIPDCQATYYPNEGHLLVLDHMGDVTGALGATLRRPAVDE